MIHILHLWRLSRAGKLLSQQSHLTHREHVLSVARKMRRELGLKI